MSMFQPFWVLWYKAGKGDSTPHTCRSLCVWVIQVPATGHGRTKEDLRPRVKEHFIGKVTVSHLKMNQGSPRVWKEVTATLSLLNPERAASVLSASRWERQNHGCHTSSAEQNLHFNQILKSVVAWWVWGMLIQASMNQSSSLKNTEALVLHWGILM